MLMRVAVGIHKEDIDAAIEVDILLFPFTSYSVCLLLHMYHYPIYTQTWFFPTHLPCPPFTHTLIYMYIPTYHTRPTT